MLDILSVSSEILRPSDIQKVQDGFAERIQCNLPQTPTIPHRLEPCDLTITYYGGRQAIFIREGDAHNKHCDCYMCARVRELLDGPAQELIPENIWGTTTRLLPYDESGDRRIFLTHVAHSFRDHINTDPPPRSHILREDFELCLPLKNGGEINLETGKVRRNVTSKKRTPVGYL